MGQKVNPTGFRLGTSKKQNANWYAKGKDFSTNLIQDLKVREYFKKKLKNSSISRIELERSAENFVVSIYTSRPGIIIGKRGEEIDNLKKAVEKIVQRPAQINIKEVKKPDLDAQILAEGVAQQLEKRVILDNLTNDISEFKNIFSSVPLINYKDNLRFHFTNNLLKVYYKKDGEGERELGVINNESLIRNIYNIYLDEKSVTNELRTKFA